MPSGRFSNDRRLWVKPAYIARRSRPFATTTHLGAVKGFRTSNPEAENAMSDQTQTTKTLRNRHGPDATGKVKIRSSEFKMISTRIPTVYPKLPLNPKPSILCQPEDLKEEIWDLRYRFRLVQGPLPNNTTLDLR